MKRRSIRQYWLTGGHACLINLLNIHNKTDRGGCDRLSPA
jgi:hypothetical protein